MAHVIPAHGRTDDLVPGPILNGGLLQRLAPYDVLCANRDELEAWLADHADLTPLLERVCARLREEFGQHAELSLEFYKDPEQQDQYPVLYVRQRKYEAGILKRIESVVNPFLPQFEAASGDLLITTDFRPARR
jgi:hypothetical protein